MMATLDPTVKARQHLVSLLKKQGALTSARLSDAFLSVPRHHFIEQVYKKIDGQWKQKPGTLEEIYSDQALVVQVSGTLPTSSSSQPSLMAAMLEALELEEGMNVLEIGAGTGYNAALIAQMVGESGRVITLDLNEELVRNARIRLGASGYHHVEVIHINGLNGYSYAGPYDRIIATASHPFIPAPWLDQLAADGKLIMPLQNQLAGALLLLTKRHKGGAYGSFLPITNVGFMPLEPVSRPERAMNKSRSRQLMLPDLEISLFENFSWKFWLHFEFPSLHLLWYNHQPVLLNTESVLKFLPASMN